MIQLGEAFHRCCIGESDIVQGAHRPKVNSLHVATANYIAHTDLLPLDTFSMARYNLNVARYNLNVAIQPTADTVTAPRNTTLLESWWRRNTV